jgi:putative tricarboxylic transport membrane protein
MPAMLPLLPSLRRALGTFMLIAGMAGSALALDKVNFTIGTNPGGGYDLTARALGQAMLDAGVARSVAFDNKGGAGGTIALAHFVSNNRGDPNALIVTGAVMIGAIIQNKPPVSLAQAVPVARLFHEYNVFVVPAGSPHKSMKDVVDLLKKDPAAVKWGGGSRGSVDQISIARLAREAGVDPSKLNYLPFQGGGEASAAIVGGYVTVGISGWSEFAPLIRSGKLRALAVTSAERLPGNRTPTLREQGFDVEVVNWRGVYGAPGITAAQRKTLERAVVAATRQKSWTDALANNAWFPAVLTGAEFEQFVASEQVRIEGSMRDVGLIK